MGEFLLALRERVAEQKGMQTGRERRNYWAFLLEGGMYVFGVGFVNGQTFLPAVILEEGGPVWLAGFVPSLLVIGLFGVPVFTAGFIDRLPRMKPFALLAGFFQRFPYVVAGLIFVFAPPSAGWVVWILALTPLLAGMLGGVGVTAWQRLYISGVPPARRASNIAFRFMIGGVTGILAGWLIEKILAAYPGTLGYGYLHLLAAACMMVSLAILSQVLEPPPEANAEVAPRQGIRKTVEHFYRKGEARKSRISFTLAVLLMHSFLLMPPFYATYLLDHLGRGSSYLGVLAMWQMGGQAMGNFFAAFLGDRWGGRATLGFGFGALSAACVMALFVDSPSEAQLAYAFFGMSQMLAIVGKETLVMELTPRKLQAGYLSLTALVTLAGLLSAGLLSQFLWTRGSLTALAFATIGLCFLGFLSLSWVQDPRAKRLPTLRAIRRGFLRFMR